MTALLLRYEDWCARQASWVLRLKAVAWYGIITYLSHIPSSASAATKGMVGGDDTLNAVFRFCAHLGVFGVLGVLVYAALHRRFVFVQSAFLTMLVTVLAAGILDEVHQSFVPGRFARVQDVVTDAAGAMMFVWGITKWRTTSRV